MKKCEFCELSLEDLCKKEAELRKELATITVRKRVTPVEKTHMFGDLKKNIARILTFRKQRFGE